MKTTVKNDGDKVWVTITHAITLENNQRLQVEAGYSKTYNPNENPGDLLISMSDEISQKVVRMGKRFKNKFNKVEE